MEFGSGKEPDHLLQKGFTKIYCKSRIGTFYEVRKSKSVSGIDSGNPTVVRSRLLFGRENTELLELTARSVAALVPGDVLVSLGFINLTKDLMEQVVAFAREHLQ